MKWICMKCGRKNDQKETHCTKCGLDEEAALTFPIFRRRKSCEECGHIHQEDIYCHVYTEAAETEMIDDVVSDDEEDMTQEEDGGNGPVPGFEDEEEEEENKSMKKPLKMRPLTTPDFVKAIRYVRCNCNVGVPNECKRFEPIPQLLVIGSITIEMYHEIVFPDYRRRFQQYNNARTSETAVIRKLEENNNIIAQSLPMIMSFLAYGECSQIPQVSKLWNYGANQYLEYIHIRDCIPRIVYRIHTGQVDSLLVANDKVYTGGDKRILVSNIYTGEVLALVTRDSGE
jgi:hypothetical protein